MRNFYILITGLLLCPGYLFALEGNDDNVTRDYYVQKYENESYIPDFETVFSNPHDRLDYKKLREYLNKKKEIERVLQMAGDEYYYGLSFSRMFAEDYIQSLEDEIKFRNPDSIILLRFNSTTPHIKYNGEYKVSAIESDILPAIKEKYKKAFERDSINQVSYTKIQENLDLVKRDVFLCEQALNTSLSPEFQQQKFRIWISLTFSMLIAVLLCAFFFIILRRSDKTLAKLLLNDTGLQFITIFVLIIALILFGILNVIGGSELAAILSGISGYILGKGGQAVLEKLPERNATGISMPDMEFPVPVAQTTYVAGSLPETREETEEDEKYFPGENV
jgi:hypothetical protein